MLLILLCDERWQSDKTSRFQHSSDYNAKNVSSILYTLIFFIYHKLISSQTFHDFKNIGRFCEGRGLGIISSIEMVNMFIFQLIFWYSQNLSSSQLITIDWQ